MVAPSVEVSGDDAQSAVNVLEHNETEGIGSLALESLPGAVVENNGTEGVDAVSGATMTSEAFFSAVNAALEQANNKVYDKNDSFAESFLRAVLSTARLWQRRALCRSRGDWCFLPHIRYAESHRLCQ